MKPQYTTVFIIRQVRSHELIKFGSKCGWSTTGAAKAAFKLHTGTLFDEQAEYVIEEVE
jgi:hypothetical protein